MVMSWLNVSARRNLTRQRPIDGSGDCPAHPYPAARSQPPRPNSELGPGSYTLNITSVDPPIDSSLTTCDLASHDESRQHSRWLRKPTAPTGIAAASLRAVSWLDGPSSFDGVSSRAVRTDPANGGPLPPWTGYECLRSQRSH